MKEVAFRSLFERSRSLFGRSWTDSDGFNTMEIVQNANGTVQNANGTVQNANGTVQNANGKQLLSRFSGGGGSD